VFCREEEEVDDAKRPSCEVAVYMVFGVQKLHQASHVNEIEETNAVLEFFP
jgi:hypothetical protein